MTTNVPNVPTYTGEVPLIGQGETEFSQNAQDSLKYQAELPVNLNSSIAAMNTLGGEVEDLAASAELSNSQASAVANFKGDWSGLTGALSTPASVKHNGLIWLLLNDLADVTASEPSVSADWEMLGNTASLKFDTIADLAAASVPIGNLVTVKWVDAAGKIGGSLFEIITSTEAESRGLTLGYTITDGFFYGEAFSIANGNVAVVNTDIKYLESVFTSSLAAVSEGFFGLSPIKDGAIYSVRGWYSDQEFGGGLFTWLPDEPKTSHDGGMFVSPTVPSVSNQTGATAAERQNNFRLGVGETDPSGSGIFARLAGANPTPAMFGGVPGTMDGDAADAAEAYVQNNSNEATVYQQLGNIAIGAKPLPFAASHRDAFQVSRYIDGKTDCHAFADKTTILNATDVGTYGTFDSQTEIAGSHNQEHQFSFQDRGKFSGTGTLNEWAGVIVWPEAPGAGHVNTRYGVWIKDVAVGASTTIDNHIGIYIDDIQFSSNKVGINVQQNSGYAYYAPNDGEFYSNGNAGFGILPDSSLAVSFADSNVRGFLTTDTSNGASIGVDGDNKLTFTGNGKVKGQFKTTASYNDAFTAGTDNLQPLGDILNRWSQVFAGTGTINTSDENEKTDLLVQSELERAAAIELKAALRKYKFKDAVEAKGEDNARIHFGIGAQTAVEILNKHGLNPFEYAFICFDEWDDIYETRQTNIGDTVTEYETRKRIKLESVTSTETFYRIEQVDGKFIRKQVTEDVTTHEEVYEEHVVLNENGTPALDEKGNQIIHRVPVMEEEKIPIQKKAEPVFEEVLVKEAGSRYGIRYDELFAFIIAAM